MKISQFSKPIPIAPLAKYNRLERKVDYMFNFIECGYVISFDLVTKLSIFKNCKMHKICTYEHHQTDKDITKCAM